MDAGTATPTMRSATVKTSRWILTAGAGGRKAIRCLCLLGVEQIVSQGLEELVGPLHHASEDGDAAGVVVPPPVAGFVVPNQPPRNCAQVPDQLPHTKPGIRTCHSLREYGRRRPRVLPQQSPDRQFQALMPESCRARTYVGGPAALTAFSTVFRELPRRAAIDLSIHPRQDTTAE